MYVFYVDEAGCTGTLPDAQSLIQPVFILGGLMIHQQCVRQLTWDLLGLKKRFFARLLQSAGTSSLDCIKTEIKGAEIRRNLRAGSRQEQRYSITLLDCFLKVLEDHNVRLLARVYIKGIGQPFNGTAVYTSAVQQLARDYQHYLSTERTDGLMILDSRNKPKNSNVSHSIFTQKFRSTGDAYERLLEMPVFGHSDNHAGLQCADLFCSALMFPLATFTYCLGHVTNPHVDAQYRQVQDHFGQRLRRMQYRYNDTGQWRGGITVSDAILHRSGTLLFGDRILSVPSP